jgi:hypothetical protein
VTELRRCAVAIYGEERAAEIRLQTALESAAAVLWRVNQEPLGPVGDEP